MFSGAHAVNPAEGETHPGSYLVPTQSLSTVEGLVLEILSKERSVVHFPAQVSSLSQKINGFEEWFQPATRSAMKYV